MNKILTAKEVQLNQHYQKNAPAWLKAAYIGDVDALMPSLDHGFWANWRAKTSGQAVIGLLLNHGKAPEVLPLLIKDGLDIYATPLGVGGNSIIKLLGFTPKDMTVKWINQLVDCGLDLHSNKEETHGLMVRLLSQRNIEAVEALINYGVKLPESTLKIVLSSKSSRKKSILTMLTFLEQHKVTKNTSNITDERFWVDAIKNGLSKENIDWVKETFGFDFKATGSLLHAALNTHNEKATQISFEWIEFLIENGANPDDKNIDGKSFIDCLEEKRKKIDLIRVNFPVPSSYKRAVKNKQSIQNKQEDALRRGLHKRIENHINNTTVNKKTSKCRV